MFSFKTRFTLNSLCVASAVAVAGMGGWSGSIARASTISYTGGSYVQNFNTLPNPGATAAFPLNPVTINGIVHTFAAAPGITDLANPIDNSGVTTGSTGGLGQLSLSGWSGAFANVMRFGAIDGNNSTPGIMSFGHANDSERALGFLSTSSSGAAYIGAALVNNSGQAINTINLDFTIELWRRGQNAKTLTFGYTIDNSNALNLVTAATSGSYVELGTLTPATTSQSALQPLNGNDSANQTPLSFASHSLVAPWQPGGTLWLTWRFTNPSTGNGLGFGIDNLAFSAPIPEPLSLTALLPAATGLLLTRRHRARR